MFRGLRPDEIELRVGTVGAKGVTMLLYKDARCDMNILDETYGTDYWQRDHKQVKENMFCGIGIYNKTIEQWIWKWDCGTESNTEKQKGEASDSFKRACFNLGIGRELYTAGLIFISCKTKQNGTKYELENKFEFSGTNVTNITYNEENNKREIVGLEISDKNGNVIFKKGSQVVKKNDPQADVPESQKANPNEKVTKAHIDFIHNTLKAKNRELEGLLAYMESEYKIKISKLEDMTLSEFMIVKGVLEKKGK